MKTTKIVYGLMFLLGLTIFVLGQQDNRSQECLKKAEDFKDKVFVLLDPGHGGPSANSRTCLGGDPGAPATHNGTEYHEACMTTDLALGLHDFLVKLGLDVGMTRNANVTQPNLFKAIEIRRQIVSKRKEKGDNFNPYFISIHFNGSKKTEVHGNYGIYAYSNKPNESVQNTVQDAQATNYLDHFHNLAPVHPDFPEISLLDNKNTLPDRLKKSIEFVLSETDEPKKENDILFNARNPVCEKQKRPSYKNMDIFRMGRVSRGQV